MNLRLTSRFAATALALLLAACGGDYDRPVAANTAPVANAGSAQSAAVGAAVSLDASASSDADGDALSYAWTITGRPVGSQAALSSDTAVKPTFSPDISGSYVFSLVVSDGKADSTASSVTVTVVAPPVAVPGAAQAVATGSVVSLAGSGTDANGATLTYAWTLTPPAGSTATLSDATSATPQFTADLPGSYVASLVVNDGQLDSAPVSVTITAAAANVAPVASAGSAQSVVRGTVVTLDGSASSDANGDALTYAWSLTTVPSGSAAALSATNAAGPTFTPDVAGTYVATLVVNDGQVDSVASTVTITATPITTTTELVVNGSFEQGLASWNQIGGADSSNTGTCSYNVATAPGVETLTSVAGFPATDGTQIALGSATSSASPHYNCTLYQDVTVPVGTTSLVLTYGVGGKDGVDSCHNTGFFSGLVATSNAAPSLLNTFLAGGNRGSLCLAADATTLATTTVTFSNAASVAGTTVRLVFINVAQSTGHEVVGIDNVHLVAVSAN